MTTFTTAADVLRRVFAKLNDAVPAVNDGTTLFAAWSKVLGGAGRTEYNVIISISDILSVLERLEMQVKSSSQLDQFLKDSAIANLSSFRPLFVFQSMNQVAASYKHILNPSLVGQLGILGLGLKDEYPEPRLAGDDIKFILETMKSVKDLLQNEAIPSDLRVNLVKNIDSVVWWISRPDMTNLQDILEKTGSTVVLAKQIEERTSNSEAADKGRSISEKIGAVFRIVSSTMKFMVGNADNIQKLENTYTALLGISSSG